MGIAHSHFYIVMSEIFAKQDISTRHHEVRRKRMAQNVCQLTARARFSITDKN